MPAKAPLDENVKFLFACLFRSDYKTIDFTRVAADFSINPAAARMRWSRLKKSINSDDIASSFVVSPTKTKSPLKSPKGHKEPKEAKHIIKEEEEEVVPREKRTERKAKVKAGQKIGLVVKMQEEEEEETDENVDVEDKDLDEAEDKKDENEKDFEQGNISSTIKTEDKQIDEVKLDNEETPTKKDDSTDQPQPAKPTFGLFRLSPSTPSVTVSGSIPTSIISTIPAPKINNETEIEALEEIIIIKDEPESKAQASTDPRTPISPTSSSSSFSPGSSRRTSPSPQPERQLERTPQKRRAGTTSTPRSQKARKRSRKSVEEDEEEDI